jgi:hypothetical protein
MEEEFEKGKLRWTIALLIWYSLHPAHSYKSI